MYGKRWSWLLSFFAVAWLGTGGLCAQPAPLGPETRVDTLTGDQFPNCPSVAVRPMGAFEIAWDYGGNLPPNIDARSYGASGAPITPQTFVGSEGFYPVVDAVSVLASGYRVLFHVVDDLGEEPPKFFRHRLHPSGFPEPGPSRPVGADDTLWVWPGTRDTLLAGKYNTAQKRLIAQKVAGNGKPTGFEYVLNSRPIVDPNPVIVALGDRRFVAVFTGRSVASGSTPARQVIRARRFSVSGPLGPDFDVNTVPGGAPGSAPFINASFVVAGDRFGKFAVAWIVQGSTGTTTRLRIFDSAGVPTGPEVVAAGPEGSPVPVSAAFDDSGRVLLLLRRTLSDPLRNDLQARVFNSAGAPIGPAFSPRSAASGDFDEPFCGSVGWAQDTWTITWSAEKAFDGPSAIFVRRFAG